MSVNVSVAHVAIMCVEMDGVVLMALRMVDSTVPVLVGTRTKILEVPGESRRCNNSTAHGVNQKRQQIRPLDGAMKRLLIPRAGEVRTKIR